MLCKRSRYSGTVLICAKEKQEVGICEEGEGRCGWRRGQREKGRGMGGGGGGRGGWRRRIKGGRKREEVRGEGEKLEKEETKKMDEARRTSG